VGWFRNLKITSVNDIVQVKNVDYHCSLYSLNAPTDWGARWLDSGTECDKLRLGLTLAWKASIECLHEGLIIVSRQWHPTFGPKGMH
jgi:hypothetical protein